MRFFFLSLFIAVSGLGLSAGVAGAAVVTIDGTPVTTVVVHDGRMLIPFRVPLEQVGAKVDWSDTAETGIASSGGHELIRTQIDSDVAYIDGFPKQLTLAPVLIDHIEYVPVELLGQISHAHIGYSDDGETATVTGFSLAGIKAVGADSASGDAEGRNLYLWVWLLPISAILCGAAYIVLNSQLQLDYRRGKGV